MVSKALVIAYAVHDTGRREVIGLDFGEVETEAFWTEFLRGLRARGLQGLRLVVSDHREGLESAITRVLDAPWQRCTDLLPLDLKIRSEGPEARHLDRGVAEPLSRQRRLAERAVRLMPHSTRVGSSRE